MRLRRFPVLLVCTALALALLCSCAAPEAENGQSSPLKIQSRMENTFATQFSVDYCEGGFKLISLSDGTRFLVVPEGASVPGGIDGDIVPLYQPVKNIYLAATASMCLFDALDRLDAIRLSGTKAEGWYVENARRAMLDGRILYAGKYSEPDYELLLSEGCPLAIESLMIGHASKVKEKLESLGIPVFTDLSSLEPHPLGRTEWIRLYGAILNEEERADEVFSRQIEYLSSSLGAAPTGKTAAFFYISTSGGAVVRKSGDYVSRMIELAGGKYVFDDIGDPDVRTSTVNLDMESFFMAAKDADYIIYNSSIGGELTSMAQLIEKNELFSRFRAVKQGNVWCTGKNMYQQTTELGMMIDSFHKIFTGEADGLDELPYLYRLR